MGSNIAAIVSLQPTCHYFLTHLADSLSVCTGVFEVEIVARKVCLTEWEEVVYSAAASMIRLDTAV